MSAGVEAKESISQVREAGSKPLWNYPLFSFEEFLNLVQFLNEIGLVGLKRCSSAFSVIPLFALIQ